MGHRSNDCAGPPGNRGKLDPYIRPRELRRDHLHSLWRRAAAPGHTIRQIASLIFDTWLCDKLFARRGLEPLVLSEPDFKLKERADKGLAPWCVNVPPYLSDTGKRRQLFYDTQAEAKTVCQQYVTRRANFGVSLATLSPKLISEAAECYERLKPYKVDLLDVVNAYIDTQRQRAASISFLELCNHYIHSRPDRNRDHLKGLENTRDRFPSLHAKMVSDVTHRDLEPLLEPISRGGRNLIMRHLRAFFNFGIKKKYLTENPIAALDFTRLPKKEVEVITIDDVRAMLNAAISDDNPLLPYLVFGFFAGVRPVIDFDWDEFDKPDKKDGLSWQDVAPVVSELGDKAKKKMIVKELISRGASQAGAYRHIETAEKKRAISLDKKSGIYVVRP